MLQRKALGKGLGVLIPSSSLENKEKQLTEIPLELIRPGKLQPRKDFSPDSLQELADSIREKGVVQPIIVRKSNAGYELIAGERRWKASKIAGLTKIPSLIKETTEAESLEIALIENIQREDLSPLEEARAYQLLMTKFNLTQEEVAQKVGKERSTVANLLRILNLPDFLKEDLKRNLISLGHARTLLSLDSLSQQRLIREQIINKHLSVREVENLINRMKEGEKSEKVKEKDIFKLRLEEDLQKKLGTRVRIKQGRKGGRIEIFFYSEQELERILEIVGNNYN